MTKKEKENTNAYQEAISSYLKQIKPLFDYKESGFNSQGGIGWEVSNKEDTIFIWFIDPNNPSKDLQHSEFNSNTAYDVHFQAEFNNDDVVEGNIATFDKIEDLTSFLKDVNSKRDLESLVNKKHEENSKEEVLKKVRRNR